MPPQKTNSDCDNIKFLFEAYPSKRRDQNLDHKEENIDDKLIDDPFDICSLLGLQLVGIDQPYVVC